MRRILGKGVEQEHKILPIISTKHHWNLLIACGSKRSVKHPSLHKHSLPKASEQLNKTKLQQQYGTQKKSYI